MHFSKITEDSVLVINKISGGVISTVKYIHFLVLVLGESMWSGVLEEPGENLQLQGLFVICVSCPEMEVGSDLQIIKRVTFFILHLRYLLTFKRCIY